MLTPVQRAKHSTGNWRREGAIVGSALKQKKMAFRGIQLVAATVLFSMLLTSCSDRGADATATPAEPPSVTVSNADRTDNVELEASTVKKLQPTVEPTSEPASSLELSRAINPTPTATLTVSYVPNPSLVDDSAPVITLPHAEAGIGEIVSVPLILTQAPNGVAGFLMEFSLADVGIGSIVSVEFPEYGLTYDAVNDGSQVRFAAADLFQLFEAGATDSTLAFVNIQGLSKGSTMLQLGVVQMDDDNGDPITPQVFDGTFTTF